MLKRIFSKIVLTAVAAAAVALPLLGDVSAARATDATLPAATEIIAGVGNATYPVLLPIMLFGIGIAIVWFIFNTIKGFAKRKS